MRILFCLGGQGLTEQWNRAAQLLDLRAHQVTILHVVDDSLITAADVAQRYTLPRGLRADREAELRQALQVAGQRVLDRALATARQSGVEAVGILRTGQPAAAILQVAREVEAEVIILGRRHPSLEGCLLGGVSRYVVDRAPCSVLLLR